MQQRDLYLVYVKQYCDSVNTFSCFLLSCFEEVRGLLLIGLKLLSVLMWFFWFLLGLKRPDQHLNASQKSPESQLFCISLKIFERPPPVWRDIPNAAAQRARELWAMAGNTKGRLCSPDGLHHTRSSVLSVGRQLWCSASLICRPARLMKWWHFLRK